MPVGVSKNVVILSFYSMVYSSTRSFVIIQFVYVSVRLSVCSSSIVCLCVRPSACMNIFVILFVFFPFVRPSNRPSVLSSSVSMNACLNVCCLYTCT